MRHIQELPGDTFWRTFALMYKNEVCTFVKITSNVWTHHQPDVDKGSRCVKQCWVREAMLFASRKQYCRMIECKPGKHPSECAKQRSYHLGRKSGKNNCSLFAPPCIDLVWLAVPGLHNRHELHHIKKLDIFYNGPGCIEWRPVACKRASAAPKQIITSLLYERLDVISGCSVVGEKVAPTSLQGLHLMPVDQAVYKVHRVLSHSK